MARLSTDNPDGDALNRTIPGPVPEAAKQALSALGFSEVETLVYFALLRAPGLTAYRIAKMIGKSQANVALALRGLSGKRAIVLAEHNPTTYDPVPAKALLAQLRNGFDANIRQASEAFDAIKGQVPTDRIRRVASIEDALALARDMLHGASETVAFWLSPRLIDRLRGDLANAAKRASVVGMTLTDEQPIPGVKMSKSRRGDIIRESTGRELVVLVVDARAVLLCFIETDGQTLKHAVWANNPVMAVFMHNALTSDIILHGSPLIDEIGSPNRFLFGTIPSAIEETFFRKRD